MPFQPLFLALAAAQTFSASQPTVAGRHFGRPFLSPMGEPFRASAPGGDALADWFHQADRNRDGFLTADEMQADAARFFALLDANHDGEIDPDEVTRYETVLAPEVQGEPAAMLARKPGENSGQDVDPDPGGDGSEISGGGSSGPQGAGRFALLNIPEPVASADANLNRGVSLDEFRRAALDRFQLLDTSHSGRLDLAQLEALRPAPPLGGFGHHAGGHHRGR